MKLTSCGNGLYRTPDGRFFERPWVNGRRTCLRVHALNLKIAREILAARRTDQARAEAGLARDPYGPPPATVAAILDAYRDAGCPNRRWQPRAGKQLYDERSRISLLAPWWGKRQADKLTVADCLGYWDARQKTIRRGHGGCAVDRELCTLRNALTWAAARGLVSSNPLTGPLPKFRTAAVRHCRECAPHDAGELHGLARYFFEQPGREVLGWQILLTALTGCRTSEVLRLRWDAVPRGAGFQDGDWLWVERSKGGVNPFALITPELRTCLNALACWRDRNHPGHPFYLPSPTARLKAVQEDWLKHALPIAAQVVCGRHVTPHGLRAFYVTARRSQGVSDAQIAAEIGDATGAAIIASTYGAVPPNWRGGGAAEVGWVPERCAPAWEHFDTPSDGKIISMDVG